MPIQYLYPNSDITTDGWGEFPGWSYAHYQHINEGTANSYPTDNKWIYFYLDDGEYTNPLSFGLGNISYYPSSLSVLMNASAGASHNRADVYLKILNGSNEVIGSNCYINGIDGSAATTKTYELAILPNITNYENCRILFSGYFHPDGTGSADRIDVHAIDVKISGNVHVPVYNNFGMFTKGAYYEDNNIELHLVGDSSGSLTSTLFIYNGVTLSGEVEFYVSGQNRKLLSASLHTLNFETINSGTDLFTFGAYSEDSGVPLHIQLCEREARLQPLYDNEPFPSPSESGYQGFLFSNSYQYNGIDGQQRWGFYTTLEESQCTDKYHFNVDEFDNDNFYDINFQYAPYADEDLMVQFQSNFGWIYGINNPTLTNAGFITYNNSSGHLGYGCGYFADVALFNNTQNNGYGYNTNIEIQTIANSGMVFDNQNSFYIWFNFVDNGNSGDKTCLFSISNNISQYNPSYPDNQIAVYYEEGSKLLTVKDDYTEQIIIGDLVSGWHLLACNVTRIHYNDIYTEWYLDGSWINGFNLINDVSSPIHNYDGKLFYIGKHFNDSNIGNFSFLCDFFAYSDEVMSPTVMGYLYDFYRRIQRPTNNYFNYIGCSGYSEILCSSNCSNRTWGDSDYIYSILPLRGDFGYSSNNFIYFYDGYNSLRNQFQTHNIIDFQSRGLNLLYGPYDTYLRFRADIDTRFKVKNISITDENGNILSQKVGPIELDGYGTCGPYEILLDTQYFSSGTFNPTRTKIYADFYVDTGCLAFVYPTGLTHASQTNNNFRNQYRNHRTLFNGTNYIFQSGEGITNLHIDSYKHNNSPDYYEGNNTFGYEFSGISDIVHDKYLGLKLTNYDLDAYNNAEAIINFRVYANFNSGNNTIGGGTFTFGTAPYYTANFSSGDVTYWVQLPDNLDYVSGFQIGFYFDIDELSNFNYQDIDLQLSSTPFVYIDNTGGGVDRLGQIKITQLDVAFEIPCTPTGINDVITLYTAGIANTGIDMPLYTSGMPHGYGYGTLFIDGAVTEELPLYIKGGLTANMPLYINGFGGTETKNLTLFLAAEESGVDYGASNNTQTLYIKSVPVASGEGFDLYITGPDSGYMYENIPLYIEGYGGSSTDATTLYIQALESGIDYGYGIGTSDLYLNGIAAHSGDPFSLYISAPTSGYLNDVMPLYLNNLDAWTELNVGANLYLQALESGNNLTTLFIKSFGVISGEPFNLHISGGVGQPTNVNTLYIDGQQHFENTIPLYLSVSYESSADFSLFTAGWGASGNKIANLFISGYGGSSINTTTLYVYGPPPSSGGVDMPLFIEGGGVDFRTLDTTLYTYNNPDNEFVNSVNLHIVGGFEYGEFPLSLYNDDTPILRNKTATLFTNGFSGVLGKLEQGCVFYIDGTSPNDSMNLYLHNSGIHSHYNTYPLYLSGKDITYSGIANWNTLYIQNEYLHIDYGCEMYLNSQEAYEESGDFNLFIARSTEAIAGNTNLYLAATNGATSEFAMYISGATYSQNNVNLSIPYVESTIINNAKLYTHGY